MKGDKEFAEFEAREKHVAMTECDEWNKDVPEDYLCICGWHDNASSQP